MRPEEIPVVGVRLETPGAVPVEREHRDRPGCKAEAEQRIVPREKRRLICACVVSRGSSDVIFVCANAISEFSKSAAIASRSNHIVSPSICQPFANARTGHGSQRVNVEPAPSAPSTVISPPMSWARLRLMVRPSPVPPCERV